MSQTVPVTQTPQLLGRMDGKTNYAALSFPVANGVTINYGDVVYFSGGTVTNATVAGARLVGMAEGTATGNAAGTVTILVCVDPQMRYLMQTTSALATSNVGQYFDATGATGAQQINTSSASNTVGPFLCIAQNVNTGIAGTQTTSYGIFVLIESAFTPYVAG